jgi:hypothetical protein
MLHWYAPHPISPSLDQRLREAEVFAGKPDEQLIDIWIYDTPDRLLASFRQNSSTSLTIEVMLKAYSSLVTQPAGIRLISGWRLEHLKPLSIRGWLSGDCLAATNLEVESEECPAICPLEGQLVLRIIEDFPSILEAYLDLELRSELMGQTADSTYLNRLLNACNAEALLESWHELHSTLQEATQQGELALLQLNQVQEELERYFIVCRDQAKLLNKQSQLTHNAIKLASNPPPFS